MMGDSIAERPSENDPADHDRVRLTYALYSGNRATYGGAAPIERDLPEFHVRLEGEEAVFTLKRSCRTLKEARDLVEPYVKAWQLSAGLDIEPGAFELQFRRAEGSNQRRGTYSAWSQIAGYVMAKPRGFSAFPDPPDKLRLDPDAEIMFARYRGFKEKREFLPSMAYMEGVPYLVEN